jgi:hypothetical protein
MRTGPTVLPYAQWAPLLVTERRGCRLVILFG